jgi:hypothetical protein
MITRKEKSFLHLQKRNSSLHPRENLLALAKNPRSVLEKVGIQQDAEAHDVKSNQDSPKLPLLAAFCPFTYASTLHTTGPSAAQEPN